MNRSSCVTLVTVILLAGAWASAQPAPVQIDFNRDIQPILSDNCYHCHGPDKLSRKADLRFDREESAFEVRKGKAPIVRGKPDQSELVRRILTKDNDEQMPPP